MKTIVLGMFSLLFILFIPEARAQDNPEVLLGAWKLDMTPQNSSDDNFAMMKITSVKEGKMKGTFYRKGVKLQKGQINTQTDVIYGALVSGDNSGS